MIEITSMLSLTLTRTQTTHAPNDELNPDTHLRRPYKDVQ